MSPELTTLATAVALLGVVLGLAQTRVIKPFIAPLLLALFTRLADITKSDTIPTLDDVLALTGLILGVLFALAFQFNAFVILGLFPNTSIWVQIIGTGLIVGGGGDAVAMLLKFGGAAAQAVTVRVQLAALNVRARLQLAQAAYQQSLPRAATPG